MTPLYPTTTDKLARYLSPANRARRVVAMQAVTIERCREINERK